MKILDALGVFTELCKQSKKYGVYISFADEEDPAEITKAAPYLDFDKHYQVLMDGRGWLLFDTEEEMLNCYERTVGDDGPTELNPYDGKVRVYALTCSPTGELWNENA